MSEKIIGYLLLLVGIVIIALAAINVYLVFTKKAQPVPLFTFAAISIDMSKLLAGNLPPEMRDKVPAIQQQIISSDMVNQPMNLFAHTVLMGFLVTVGLKLAQIGTMLLRPIIVHVKEKKET